MQYKIKSCYVETAFLREENNMNFALDFDDSTHEI